MLMLPPSVDSLRLSTPGHVQSLNQALERQAHSHKRELQTEGSQTNTRHPEKLCIITGGQQVLAVSLGKHSGILELLDAKRN